MPRPTKTKPADIGKPAVKSAFAGFVTILMNEDQFAEFDQQFAKPQAFIFAVLSHLDNLKLTCTPRPDGSYNACIFPQEDFAEGKGVSAFADTALEAIGLAYWKYRIWANDPALTRSAGQEVKRRG